MVPPERISKFLSYVLRHQPTEYPIAFDRHGFVDWNDLIGLVTNRFAEASAEDVLRVVNDPDKKRFELKGGKARATYGHSFPVDLGLEPIDAPSRLYHGTARDLARSILKTGLRPRGRQFVHLSASPEEALAVGKRRDPAPAVIAVNVDEARSAGVVFYASGPLFLVTQVPARFLSLWQQ